jgi:hypothetical protein
MPDLMAFGRKKRGEAAKDEDCRWLILGFLTVLLRLLFKLIDFHFMLYFLLNRCLTETLYTVSNQDPLSQQLS